MVNNFNSNYTEQVNSILKEETNNQPLINSENEPSVFKRKPKLKTRNKNGITKLNISDANPRTNSKTQKINNNKKTEEIKSNIKTEETKSNIKTKSNKTEKINPFYSNHNQAPNKIIPAKNNEKLPLPTNSKPTGSLKKYELFMIYNLKRDEDKDHWGGRPAIYLGFNEKSNEHKIMKGTTKTKNNKQTALILDLSQKTYFYEEDITIWFN